MSSITTSCKECFFAKFDGNFQIGCNYHDRLEDYIEKGKASLVQWDGEKCYYMVDGLCQACTKPNGIMPPLEEVAYAVDKKLYIHNTFVLPISEPNDAAITHFLDVAVNQEGIAPDLLIVFAKTVPDNYIASIYANSGGKVTVTKLLNDEYVPQYAVKLPQTEYVTLLQPGWEIPKDLNKAINTIRQSRNFQVIRPIIGMHGLVMTKLRAKYKTIQENINLKASAGALEWTQWQQKSLS